MEQRNNCKYCIKIQDIDIYDKKENKEMEMRQEKKASWQTFILWKFFTNNQIMHRFKILTLLKFLQNLIVI